MSEPLHLAGAQDCQPLDHWSALGRLVDYALRCQPLVADLPYEPEVEATPEGITVRLGVYEVAVREAGWWLPFTSERAAEIAARLARLLRTRWDAAGESLGAPLALQRPAAAPWTALLRETASTLGPGESVTADHTGISLFRSGQRVGHADLGPLWWERYRDARAPLLAARLRLEAARRGAGVHLAS